MALAGWGLSEYYSSIVALDQAGDTTSTKYSVDVTMFVLLFIAEFVFFYRLIFGVIDMIEYFTLSDELLRIKYASFEELIGPDGDFNTFEFYQYTFFYVFGPKKVSLIGEAIATVAFGLMQDWAKMGFYALPLIPSFLIEWAIFTWVPELEMPFVDLRNLFQPDGDNVVGVVDSPAMDAKNAAA